MHRKRGERGFPKCVHITQTYKIVLKVTECLWNKPAGCFVSVFPLALTGRQHLQFQKKVLVFRPCLFFGKCYGFRITVGICMFKDFKYNMQEATRNANFP